MYQKRPNILIKRDPIYVSKETQYMYQKRPNMCIKRGLLALDSLTSSQLPTDCSFYVCTSIHSSINPYLPTYLPIYLPTYHTYTYIYIHIYTCLYIYIFTYIHIYRQGPAVCESDTWGGSSHAHSRAPPSDPIKSIKTGTWQWCRSLLAHSRSLSNIRTLSTKNRLSLLANRRVFFWTWLWLDAQIKSIKTGTLWQRGRYIEVFFDVFVVGLFWHICSRSPLTYL